MKHVKLFENFVNEASFNSLSGLANLIKLFNSTCEISALGFSQPDRLGNEKFEDLRKKVKEAKLTSSNVFQFSAMFPRNSFKIQDIVSGKLEGQVKRVTFKGPGLDEDIKKIAVLKEVILAMDEWYGDRTWITKY